MFKQIKNVWKSYMRTPSHEQPFGAYNNFMDKYQRDHECCPQCGSKAHIHTLVGYIVRMDKLDEYKDLNRCTCHSCGDIHTTHDRVPEECVK